MISECEENGWEFITGGFLDRIGEKGEFPLVTKETNIWKSFPLAGFFRYPMSGAMPNKVLCNERFSGCNTWTTLCINR